jgi:thermostable 8-oxoguanine DNA glycosylase
MDSTIQLMESEEYFMNFEEFCLRIANLSDVEEISTSEQVPFQYQQSLDVLVNMIKNKIDRFASVKISFIQNKFDNMEEVKEVMETVYHGEVCTSLSQALAQMIYGMDYNDLLQIPNRLAIIKVLTIYLMIQNATQYN